MSVIESRVIYLMGASGSGKDSVMRGCRRQLTEADRCFIAHRYITREPETAGENHIWLTDAEFDKREKLGAFAMHWQAHGHRYAIGAEINHWLDQGISVVVNGSRSFLADARQRYHHRLVPVVLDVPLEQLRTRLLERGRESEADVDRRLARSSSAFYGSEYGVRRIDNSGSPEHAVAALLGLIRGLSLGSDLPDRRDD